MPLAYERKVNIFDCPGEDRGLIVAGCCEEVVYQVSSLELGTEWTLLSVGQACNELLGIGDPKINRTEMTMSDTFEVLKVGGGKDWVFKASSLQAKHESIVQNERRIQELSARLGALEARQPLPQWRVPIESAVFTPGLATDLTLADDGFIEGVKVSGGSIEILTAGLYELALQMKVRPVSSRVPDLDPSMRSAHGRVKVNGAEHVLFQYSWLANSVGVLDFTAQGTVALSCETGDILTVVLDTSASDGRPLSVQTNKALCSFSGRMLTKR